MPLNIYTTGVVEDRLLAQRHAEMNMEKRESDKDVWWLEVYQSEMCCGFAEIGTFPFGVEDVRKFDVAKGLKQAMMEVPGGAALITLNSQQRKAGVEQIVLEHGFKPVLTFHNPGHRGFVRVYIWDKYPKKKPKVKKENK